MSPADPIDQAIEMIVSGEIVHFRYDVATRRLVKR